MLHSLNTVIIFHNNYNLQSNILPFVRHKILAKPGETLFIQHLFCHLLHPFILFRLMMCALLGNLSYHIFFYFRFMKQ